MAISGVNFNSLSVSVEQAVKNFGLTDNDLAKINKNNDNYITAGELASAGYATASDKLANFFNERSQGNYFTSLGIKQTNPQVQPVNKAEKTVADNNVSFAGLFNKSHNQGELSPVVSSDTVGKVLPRLYA